MSVTKILNLYFFFVVVGWLFLRGVGGVVLKHFNTSLGAEVLETGLELHSYVEFDENHTRMCGHHPEMLSALRVFGLS